MQYLFELGNEWTFSKIYFDSEKDCFIEERYHYEYLDTGTIGEGQFPIDDAELWEKIVRGVHEEGAREFLKIRGTAPECPSTGISLSKFMEELKSLHQSTPHCGYSFTKTGDVWVLKDEQKNILGVASKTEGFWFFIGNQKHGFHTQEELLEYVLKTVCKYHNHRPEVVLPETEVVSSNGKKRGLFSKRK